MTLCLLSLCSLYWVTHPLVYFKCLASPVVQMKSKIHLLCPSACVGSYRLMFSTEVPGEAVHEYFNAGKPFGGRVPRLPKGAYIALPQSPSWRGGTCLPSRKTQPLLLTLGASVLGPIRTWPKLASPNSKSAVSFPPSAIPPQLHVAGLKPWLSVTLFTALQMCWLWITITSFPGLFFDHPETVTKQEA